MTTTRPHSAPTERPSWLPWSTYPFPTRFVDLDGALVHYVDEGAGPTQRFRALVATNTFAWPLAGYPAVRRALRIVASPQFGAINRFTNLLALFTATGYGVGRRMSRSDRRSFLGPWRSRDNRVATQRILASALGIDPLLADIESSLEAELSGLPVLTLFGRKNDRYGWQRRFHRVFPGATGVTVDDGHHFPFDDDPEGYADAIHAWWTAKVSPRLSDHYGTEGAVT